MEIGEAGETLRDTLSGEYEGEEAERVKRESETRELSTALAWVRSRHPDAELAFCLRHVDGLSIAQVAARLGVSEATAARWTRGIPPMEGGVMRGVTSPAHRQVPPTHPNTPQT